ncbi:MAG: hypothetical protein R2717_09800 [Schumannella sp.]
MEGDQLGALALDEGLRRILGPEDAADLVDLAEDLVEGELRWLSEDWQAAGDVAGDPERGRTGRSPAPSTEKFDSQPA